MFLFHKFVYSFSIVFFFELNHSFRLHKLLSSKIVLVEDSGQCWLWRSCKRCFSPHTCHMQCKLERIAHHSINNKQWRNENNSIACVVHTHTHIHTQKRACIERMWYVAAARAIFLVFMRCIWRHRIPNQLSIPHQVFFTFATRAFLHRVAQVVCRFQ